MLWDIHNCYISHINIKQFGGMENLVMEKWDN